MSFQSEHPTRPPDRLRHVNSDDDAQECSSSPGGTRSASLHREPLGPAAAIDISSQLERDDPRLNRPAPDPAEANSHLARAFISLPHKGAASRPLRRPYCPSRTSIALLIAHCLHSGAEHTRLRLERSSTSDLQVPLRHLDVRDPAPVTRARRSTRTSDRSDRRWYTFLPNADPAYAAGTETVSQREERTACAFHLGIVSLRRRQPRLRLSPDCIVDAVVLFGSRPAVTTKTIVHAICRQSAGSSLFARRPVDVDCDVDVGTESWNRSLFWIGAISARSR
jgi:hypothetical protein